jgi:uroporphyrinogen decarboxylase
MHILNPVQISARGMDPAVLKAWYGRDLVFWGGGCDVQHVLPTGTARQVEENVRRYVAILMEGGG